MPTTTAYGHIPAPTIEQDRAGRMALLIYNSASHLDQAVTPWLIDAQHYLCTGGTDAAMRYLNLAKDSCQVVVAQWATGILTRWNETPGCKLHYGGYAECQLFAGHNTKHRDANGHQFVLPDGHPGHLAYDRACPVGCEHHPYLASPYDRRR